jgi:predicted DNA-binding transcriptional regulator YafY
MAKDTEKLIRQLSLISFLMAERRPVTAAEIRADVEGYSAMNEDAFARRFYADRSELEALGIVLAVEKPVDGMVEQETYSLPAENFHLPPISFTDEELAALRTALQLLDGEFAYAEPLRLALQQIVWGHPSPLTAPEQRTVALGITGSAGGSDVSQRLTKIETAIFRRKTIVFDYYTIERDDTGTRRVDPYQLLYQGGQFYLVGRSHERDAIRVFRLSRIRGKVAYATKAEHDFQRPQGFDPHAYANRIKWQFGDPVGTAEVLVKERIAWQIERLFGSYGEMRDSGSEQGKVFVTPYADSRQLIAWVLGLGENARIVGPPELESELQERLSLLVERHEGEPQLPAAEHGQGASTDASPHSRSRPDDDRPTEHGLPSAEPSNGHHADAAIRPERFARLVTLATMLIGSGRAGHKLSAAELCHATGVSEQELREDIAVLNLVNFGAGTYVLYAEIDDEGMVEVDPEPYGDSFARPARLLPVEAKALIAAIDLIGDHIPAGSLASVREKVVAALGEDPAREGLQVAPPTGDDSRLSHLISRSIAEHELLALEYYKENEDEFSRRDIEPYALINGREGWYVMSYDTSRDAVRHFRLDRIKSATPTGQRFEPRHDIDPVADIDGWPRTGEVPASRQALVWISPERARWVREQRPVQWELEDGSVVVAFSFAGLDWLVREVLKEAGDAAVLEPADARAAVHAAAAQAASA